MDLVSFVLEVAGRIYAWSPVAARLIYVSVAIWVAWWVLVRKDWLARVPIDLRRVVFVAWQRMPRKACVVT
jgi:hypothetical protein